jgi:predicted DCC family thiol-disulfide oxidoreductase YuxK
LTEITDNKGEDMSTTYPLTVYFDASCALCNSEMQNIKQHDTENRLTLTDCSAPDFDDRAFHPEGITRDAMMNCLHAQDPDGNWLKGVAAFEVIYRTVGMASIATLGAPAHPPRGRTRLSLGREAPSFPVSAGSAQAVQLLEQAHHAPC